MDRIEINQMEFYGYHGILPEERRLGQRFTVDVKLYFDLAKAAVRSIIEGKPLHLIETIAEKIAAALLAGYPLDAVRVAVHKPDAPIHGKFGDVCAQIKRTRPL